MMRLPLVGSVTLEHKDGSETRIDIGRELLLKARLLGWSGFELIAEAAQALNSSSPNAPSAGRFKPEPGGDVDTEILDHIQAPSLGRGVSRRCWVAGRALILE